MSSRRCRRPGKREKKAAYARIKAEADGTRQALEDRRADLGTSMGLVRDWMATMQEVEERILKTDMEILEGERLAAAQKLMSKMESARNAARGFRTSTKAADYGTALRKGWAGPRRKLLALIKKQQREDEKALEGEGEEADG